MKTYFFLRVPFSNVHCCGLLKGLFTMVLLFAIATSAVYVVQAQQSCSGVTRLTSNSGSFSDRVSGLAAYSDNLNCQWVIEPPDRRNVVLQFSRFSTESCCDIVTVYDGTTVNAPILGQFSGTDIPPVFSTVSRSGMLVRFTTDGSVTSSGWAASYGTIDSTIIIDRFVPPVLASPANGALDVTITPTFTMSFPNGRVSADWVTLQISRDSLFQSGNIVWRYRNGFNNASLSNNQGFLFALSALQQQTRYFWRVAATPDTITSVPRWSVTRNFTTQILTCQGVTRLTDAAGTFSDRTLPTPTYANNLNCQWLIQPTNGQRITLSFSAFQTEQNGDGVTVYDGATTGSPVIGQFTGSTLPYLIRSSGGALLVQFQSNSSTALRGWTAEYSTASIDTNVIRVTLPQLTLSRGTPVVIPLQVSNLTGQNIYAYQISLAFSGDVLSLTNATVAGTLSDGGVVTANASFGRLTLNVYRTTPLSGSGTLINLIGTVPTQSFSSASSTPIIFNGFQFNEGAPRLTVERGLFSIAFLCGDVSEGGGITAADATFTAQVAAGLRSLSTAQARAADVSGNGSVTVYDAALIARYATGLITSFPGGCPVPTVAVSSTVVETPPFASFPDTPKIVDIAVGSVNVPVGSRVLIPIHSENIAAAAVLAYQGTLRYDAKSLRILGIKQENSLAEQGMFFSKLESDNTMRFTYFGERQLSGNGNLFAVEAEVLLPGESSITLESVLMNEGNPSAQIKQGKAVGLTTTAVRQETAAAEETIRLSPNPANSACRATFVLPSASDYSVSIFNSLGQEVWSSSYQNTLSGEITVDLSVANLAVGTYSCRVRSSRNSFAAPLMILR